MSVVISDIVIQKPVLFGDILLSRTDIRGKNITVPTVHDINGLMSEASQGSIQGYSQKLLCLRDDVAVGWSGSLAGASIACQEMDRYLPTTGTTIDLLLATIGCIRLETEYHTRMLLWIGNANPKCYLWDSNAFDELAPIKLPYVIGSGSEHIKALFKAHGYEQGDDYRGSVIAYAGNIISYELAYGLNIRDLWGGSIEIIYLDSNQHYNIFTDYILLFFYINEKPNKDFESTMHPFIFRPLAVHKYYIIQRFDWHKKQVDYFAAPNILHMKDPIRIADINPPTYRPSYYCFSGIFHHTNGGDSPFSFVIPQSESEGYFDMDFVSGNIKFSMQFFRVLVNVGKYIQGKA